MKIAVSIYELAEVGEWCTMAEKRRDREMSGPL